MKSPLVSLSSVLEDMFVKKQSAFSEIYFIFQLRRQWKSLAGTEIARQAVPVGFKNQQLFLALPNASCRQEMHFAREPLRKKINKVFPERKIQKIILRTL